MPHQAAVVTCTRAALAPLAQPYHGVSAAVGVRWSLSARLNVVERHPQVRFACTNVLAFQDPGVCSALQATCALANSDLTRAGAA